MCSCSKVKVKHDVDVVDGENISFNSRHIKIDDDLVVNREQKERERKKMKMKMRKTNL